MIVARSICQDRPEDDNQTDDYEHICLLLKGWRAPATGARLIVH